MKNKQGEGRKDERKEIERQCVKSLMTSSRVEGTVQRGK